MLAEADTQEQRLLPFSLISHCMVLRLTTQIIIFLGKFSKLLWGIISLINALTVPWVEKPDFQNEGLKRINLETR